jgi:hypothetical protein
MPLSITHTFVSSKSDGPNNTLVRASDWNASHTISGSLEATTNTVTFSATPNFDLSLGNFQKIVLTGDVTSSTISNLVAGQKIVFVISQDSSGNHAFTWATNIKGGITIGTTASKTNVQEFISHDGTTLYATSYGAIDLG